MTNRWISENEFLCSWSNIYFISLVSQYDSELYGEIDKIKVVSKGYIVKFRSKYNLIKFNKYKIFCQVSLLGYETMKIEIKNRLALIVAPLKNKYVCDSKFDLFLHRNVRIRYINEKKKLNKSWIPFSGLSLRQVGCLINCFWRLKRCSKNEFDILIEMICQKKVSDIYVAQELGDKLNWMFESDSPFGCSWQTLISVVNSMDFNGNEKSYYSLLFTENIRSLPLYSLHMSDWMSHHLRYSDGDTLELHEREMIGLPADLKNPKYSCVDIYIERILSAKRDAYTDIRAYAYQYLLFGTSHLYNIYLSLYPEHVCGQYISVELNEVENKIEKNVRMIGDMGNVRVIGNKKSLIMNENNLIECVRIKKNIGIYLYLPGHSNILWISNGIAQRYDPEGTSEIDWKYDKILEIWCKEKLGIKKYKTLGISKCIQNKLLGGYTSLCTELSFLYLRYRIEGLSHNETIRKMDEWDWEIAMINIKKLLYEVSNKRSEM